MSTTLTKENERTTGQKISLVVAAILVILAFTMPGIGPLSKEMVRVICLLAFAVELWVVKPIPMLATSLLAIILQPLTGLTASLGEALNGFTSSAIYFIVASMAFALAMKKTSLSYKLLKWMLKVSKGNMKLIMFAFVIVTFVLSMFISDIPAIIIMVGFALEFTNMIDDEDQKYRVSKALTVLIPFGSIIGGTATPVGSSINVMATSLLESHAGETINFLKFCAIALPPALIGIIWCWFIATRLHRKCENISADRTEKFCDYLEDASQKIKRENKKETVTLVILGLTLLGWILGSFVKIFDTTMIAIISLGAFFVVGAFTWREFTNSMAWEIPFVTAATISAAKLAVSTGLVDIVINKVTVVAQGIGLFPLVIVVGLLVTVLLLAVPVGPTMISMLAIPSYMMAEALGANPVLILMVVAIFASNCTMLPTNSVQMCSYSKGFYSIKDLASLGSLTTIGWLLATACWFMVVDKIMF